MAASTSSAISIRAQVESGTCERNEFGESHDCDQGSCLRQLASSCRAACNADRCHAGSGGRLHVPDRIAHVAAARRLDAEFAGGKEKQIWSRLGTLDIAAVDDDGARRARQRLERCVDLFPPTGGRDRPSLPALVESLQQLEGAGECLGVEIQVAVNVAGAAIDFLLSIRVQSLAGRFSHDTGQPPAIRSDEAGDEHTTGWYSLFLESSQPRDNPGLDGIDQRSIEIEDPRVWLNQIDSY